MGMVIGLGITRLLSGVARIIQHPTQYKAHPMHLAWVISVLLSLLHFWWWEFSLYQIEHWTFSIYLFIIFYAIVLFLMCAFIFPDNLAEYDGYFDYLMLRRAWFFGALAITYILDVVDTCIKGEAHFSRFGHEYLVRTPILVILCLIAIRTKSLHFHAPFVMATLAYQSWWIFRFFGNLS